MDIVREVVARAGPKATTWPIMVCLLGNFRLLKADQPVAVRNNGKMEALLCALALRTEHGLPRDQLLHKLWPDSPDLALAGQALHSLVHCAHKLLGDMIGGAAPVLHQDGYYWLNTGAGVTVDVIMFDALAREGHQQWQAHNFAAAAASYNCAVELYHGDLCIATDVHALVERERLRALHLTLLGRLADFHFGADDYAACLENASRLLSFEPCREDAHRLIMRCYVRQGERAQALRQYRLCANILRSEFDAAPEPATTTLFDLLRNDPGSV